MFSQISKETSHITDSAKIIALKNDIQNDSAVSLRSTIVDSPLLNLQFIAVQW